MLGGLLKPIGAEIIGGSLLAEGITGQIELIAAELVIVGAVLAVRHFKNKKR